MVEELCKFAITQLYNSSSNSLMHVQLNSRHESERLMIRKSRLQKNTHYPKLVLYMNQNLAHKIKIKNKQNREDKKKQQAQHQAKQKNKQQQQQEERKQRQKNINKNNNKNKHKNNTKSPEYGVFSIWYSDKKVVGHSNKLMLSENCCFI